MATKQSARMNEPARGRELDLVVGLSAWHNKAVDVMTRAGEVYTSGVAAIGEEMASFMQARLEHNIALGESLTRCHTLTDITNVQRGWMKEATEEYAAETRKLIELGSSLMRESWIPLEQTAAALAETKTEESKQG